MRNSNLLSTCKVASEMNCYYYESLIPIVSVNTQVTADIAC